MFEIISNKNETAKLFDNPILERLSHVNPITPLIFYTPIIIYFFYLSITKFNWYVVLPFMLLGLILWNLSEYVVHRFVFHHIPSTPLGKRISFTIHGIHHAYPRDRTRLVLPLSASIILLSFYFGIFYLVFGKFIYPFFTGFLFGYVLYDMMHFMSHHYNPRSRILKYIKKHHLYHHYKSTSHNFTFTGPIWDYVFGTEGKENFNVNIEKTDNILK